MERYESSQEQGRRELSGAARQAERAGLKNMYGFPIDPDNPGDQNRPSKTVRLGHGKPHGQPGRQKEWPETGRWRAKGWARKLRGRLPHDR